MSPQEAGDAVVDGEACAGQNQEDGSEQEVTGMTSRVVRAHHDRPPGDQGTDQKERGRPRAGLGVQRLGQARDRVLGESGRAGQNQGSEQGSGQDDNRPPHGDPSFRSISGNRLASRGPGSGEGFFRVSAASKGSAPSSVSQS